MASEKGLPRVEKIPENLSKKWGSGTVAIPSPREVEEIMKKVPEGKVITINEIRSIIAKRHGATMGCPITTGIFAWITANAAEEDAKEGKSDFTPYWRTLKTDGSINEKYPGGIEAQKRLLEKERHTIVQKGKKYVVADYKSHLAKIC